jgi:hypothetical protein
MAETRAGKEPTPSEEELQAMMPTVLQLQRLIQDRLSRALRPNGEPFSISLTSCNHNSCN